MESKPQCVDCAYSFENYDIEDDTGEHFLQCRRYPPQNSSESDGCIYSSFAYVHLYDFCGEFVRNNIQE